MARICKKKIVVATSHGTYRNVMIYETNNGYSVIMRDGRQYDFLSLSETTAFIDSLYAAVLAPEVNRAN